VRAVRERGLESIAEVQRVTRAGTGCGTCHGEIEEILRTLAGKPVSRTQHFTNRALCQHEGERRIEEALAILVAAELPPGSSVELAQLRGLEVELLLRGEDSHELRTRVVEALRKAVCSDFEVRFR
jgi:bacterioferritin-associated ferredoxin